MKVSLRKLFAAALWILITMASVAVVNAQDESTEITRVFQLDRIEPSNLAETLSLFSARIVHNDALNTLTVRALPDIMPAIEDVVARLDVVSVERTVEMTAYIVRADDQSPTQIVPEHLRIVIDQLRNTFSYRNYQLLDTIIVRGFDGRESKVQGILSPPEYEGSIADQPTFYNFEGVFHLVTSDDGTSSLRIDEMRSGFRIPVRTNTRPFPEPPTVMFQYIDVGINTDVEIPAGSQVVVGKVTVGESAFFLVMTAEFPN